MSASVLPERSGHLFIASLPLDEMAYSKKGTSAAPNSSVILGRGLGPQAEDRLEDPFLNLRRTERHKARTSAGSCRLHPRRGDRGAMGPRDMLQGCRPSACPRMTPGPWDVGSPKFTCHP